MLHEEVRALLTNAAPPAPVQPKHLPASDPSLATEIMPAPPPLSYIFPPANSHHKRPVTVVSHLPMLDPGSTYVNSLSLSTSDGGTLTPGGVDDDSRRKKRSKPHKATPPKQATRSSARHVTPHGPISAPTKPLGDLKDGGEPPATSTRASRQVSPASLPRNSMAANEPTTSRRSARKVKLTVSEPVVTAPEPSSELVQTSATVSAPLDAQIELPLSEDRATSVLNQSKPLGGVDGVSEVRYKGKNKARDDTGTPLEGGSDLHQSSHSPYPDVCSSCVTTVYQHPSMANLPVSAYDREGGGALLYCDSCPRSFHLLCMNPPIDGQGGKEEIPEGGWYCQECSAEHDFLSTGRMPSPPPQPGTELFGPLLARLKSTNPSEFQLPEDIRTYYKNVVTGPRGGYIDGRKWKLAKGNKQLLFEDRDLFKLRDRHNRPVLCFKCGGSAVRTAVSGDPHMASILPSSPTSDSQELSTANLSALVSSSQTIPPVDMPLETTNLDILSSAAAEAEPDATVVAPQLKLEPPAAADIDAILEPLPNGLAIIAEAEVTGEPTATASTSTSKSKPNLKRKRELSPVAGVPVLPVDNNSQNGPRTRRRTEHGGSIANGKGFGTVEKVYDPSDGGRPIISCDYCPLHWHMDCLDPPMVAIPGRERKWMCPNHIEHIFSIKPRIPRQSPNDPPEITKPGQYNSGIVNIVSYDTPPPPPPPRKKKTTVKMGRIEEMFLGMKLYRVPEAVVRLDFWRKVRDPNAPVMRRRATTDSSMDVDNSDDDSSSSSLTELSSSDEEGKKSGISDKENPLSERNASRGLRGGMRGGMRGGHPPREGRAKKPKAPPKPPAVPSRSMPRRGATKKKDESSDDNKPGSLQPNDEEPTIPLSPAKPATVNSKGGLTLRIPKPTGSPNGLEKRLGISGPSKLGLSNDMKDILPIFPSLVFQATTPPYEENPANASSANSSPRPGRSKRVKGIAPPSRTGLRSSRSAGPHSDTPASPHHGDIGEVGDGATLPPNDADNSNGTIQVSSILDLPTSDGLPGSPVTQDPSDPFASTALKSYSGSDMDLGL